MDKLKHWVKNVTQWLGLSICDPKLGENNLALFRVLCRFLDTRSRSLTLPRFVLNNLRVVEINA